MIKKLNLRSKHIVKVLGRGDIGINMKKVLILGGAGFIGINVAKTVTKKNNYKVTIADNLSRGKLDSYLTELLKNKNLDLVEGDFTKMKLLIFWIKTMIIVICWHQ